MTMAATEESVNKQSISGPETERALLASILADNSVLDEVVEMISPSDFTVAAYRAIATVVFALYEKGQPVDSSILEDTLSSRGLLAEAGGPGKAKALVEERAHNAGNSIIYAQMVRDKALQRKMVAAARKIVEEGVGSVDNVYDYIDRAESRIFAVSEQKAHKPYIHISDVVKETMDEIDRMVTMRKVISGVPTGFLDFDAVTGGLQNTNLILMAARPGQGKTALALNILLHCARTAGIPAGMFSLEMSKEELNMRFVCSDAKVNYQRVRTGMITQDEINRMVKSLGTISDSPIYVDDTGMLTITELRARARRMKREKGIGLIIVDYLQLMRSGTNNRGGDGRTFEVSEISRGLKLLAKELKVPVLALSQLSRETEKREDRRPRLSDLRESGSLEQDADVVVFIHREEMYSKENTPADLKGVAEVILGKHRNGALSTVKLAYHDKYTRFDNMLCNEIIYPDSNKHMGGFDDGPDD